MRNLMLVLLMQAWSVCASAQADLIHLAADKFTNAQAGNVLTVEPTFFRNAVQQLEMNGNILATSKTTAGSIVYTLTQVDIDKLKATGMDMKLTNGTIIYIFLNDATTGISNPISADVSAPPGLIYSLDGRRLNQTPSQGIYITNGKKYLAH